MVKSILPLLLLLLLLLFGLPLLSMAAPVSAVPDRTRLGAGESLQLELRVQGSPGGEADLQPLAGDWEILSRAQSSQMQMINGDFSRSLTLTLVLMPRRSGALTLPPLCFGADCSAPQTIQVSSAAAAVVDDHAPLLLEIAAEPRQAVVGAQVLVTVRLLHRVDLVAASLSSPQPQGVKAEIQPFGKDRPFEVRRNDLLYQGIERRYLLFPRQAGTLHLPGLQLDAQVAVAPSRNDPFGRSVKSLRRISSPLDLRVDPVPVDPAHRLWLPARSLTLTDDWQGRPPTLRVGEPATRTLQLRVSGLTAGQLSPLMIPLPPEWKSYPDQPARQDESDDAGVIGILQQKIALIPTRPGPALLPAIDLDWYDIGRRQWQRAHIEALPAVVAPAVGGATYAASPPSPLTTPSPQLPAPLPPRSGAASPSPGFSRLWLGLGLLGGSALLLTLFLRGRRKRRSLPPAPDQSRFSCRQREKEALQALEQATRKNDPQASRQALLAWSRCCWPEVESHDLERLARICGEPLATEVARLGRALYAEGESSWSGRELAAGVERWRQNQEQRGEQESLPPLYPRPKG